MPVLLQRFIDRQDLKNNPTVLYVFGDNMQETGFGGQAKAMRGEPNAVGIPTKWAPIMHPSGFFRDEHDLAVPLVRLRNQFLKLREHLEKGGVIVLPADGIGIGFARLQINAPKYLGVIESEIAALRIIAESKP